MSKISRFVIWICSKFNRQEIEQIVTGLGDILKDRNPEVKPKDDFKEKHPNYRKFYVDPNPPLTEAPPPVAKMSTLNYKILLASYEASKGKPLAPVKVRNNSQQVPDNVTCLHCNAPNKYLYYNNGKRRSQLKCKVCSRTFQLPPKSKNKSKYYCPYCGYALFKWKERKDVIIYKCDKDNCPHRTKALGKLNSLEKKEREKRSSQFKLRYQYRDYQFDIKKLKLSAPSKPRVDLTKIHNSQNILGLVLTFYIFFALSARKTALILKSVFNIDISFQTVLNYAQAAAYYCHPFNLQNKGPIDDICPGDETYIKIRKKNYYVYFFISSKSLKITSYHVADSRGVLPATTSMVEAIRTASPEQEITLVTDGNPSYPAGIHFINSNKEGNKNVQFKKVVGLQNLDSESEEFRPYKQIIERLNRTYKHHIKPSHTFNSFNGPVALTTLFVTHYNFLRPHYSLYGKTPIRLPELNKISTIQGKWLKILSLAQPDVA